MRYAFLISLAAMCVGREELLADPPLWQHDDPPACEQGWSGKTVLFLGDSITDAALRHRWKNYWAYLPELLGICPAVYGCNGDEWSGVYGQACRAKSEMGDAPDAVFVFAGTNDFALDVPMGEWYDVATAEVNRWGKNVNLPRRMINENPATFRGRINRVLKYLKTEFPDSQVVLMTPTHREFFTCGGDNIQPGESYPNACGLYLCDYVNAIREGARIWSVPVIDLYAESGLCPMVAGHGAFFAKADKDRLHPSSEGHRRIALLIAAKLRGLPATFKKDCGSKKVRLVAFGDSITQAIIGVKPEETWLGVVQRRFGRNLLVFNAGIGGNSARDAMARFMDDVVAKKPDVVTIEFGGNNNDFSNPSRRVGDDEFREHLKRFRSGLPGGCRVIAVTFPPIKDDWHRVYQGSPTNYVGDVALDSQRRILRDFANESKWMIVDLHELMINNRDELLQKDGVHLNPKGQKVFGDAVCEALSKSVSELARGIDNK